MIFLPETFAGRCATFHLVYRMLFSFKEKCIKTDGVFIRCHNNYRVANLAVFVVDLMPILRFINIFL